MGEGSWGLQEIDEVLVSSRYAIPVANYVYDSSSPVTGTGHIHCNKTRRETSWHNFSRKKHWNLEVDSLNRSQWPTIALVDERLIEALPEFLARCLRRWSRLSIANVLEPRTETMGLRLHLLSQARDYLLERVQDTAELQVTGNSSRIVNT
jgi:hypothetical protein